MFSAREVPMTIRFPGTDDTSPNGDSPSVWDDGDSYVIQGWKITDEAVLSELLRTAGQSRIPAHEGQIRFPKRLMRLFPEVGNGGETSGG
jgi:hypothetical protein